MGHQVKRTVGIWIISISLCAVSFEGLWSLPGIVRSSRTTLQYLVAVSQAAYVMAGIAIVIGLWRDNRSTRPAVVSWGIASTGAAIGGPLAFGPDHALTSRTAILIMLMITVLTLWLFWYVRRIVRH